MNDHCMIDVQYRHLRVYIDASIGLNRSPILNLKLAVNYKDVALGGEVGFDAAYASFTKYTAAIGMPKLGATLLLSHTLKSVKCKMLRMGPQHTSHIYSPSDR